MTGKDDPTISCTHLMVKLSVLAGRKIIWVVTTPFARRGLNDSIQDNCRDPKNQRDWNLDPLTGSRPIGV